MINTFHVHISKPSICKHKKDSEFDEESHKSRKQESHMEESEPMIKKIDSYWLQGLSSDLSLPVEIKCHSFVFVDGYLDICINV